MYNTESFYRARIADTIQSNESVPFTKNISKVPELSEGFITINPDTDNEELFYFSSTTGTPGEAGTITFSARGYNKGDGLTDTGNQKEHALNSVMKGALNHIIINNKVNKLQDNTVEAEIIFSATDKIGLTVNSLTTAQRDLLTPSNGAIIYNTDTNVLQQYIGGGWSDIGNTGTPDASETVAGKLEIATDAELAAGTSTGGTGARLGISVDNTSITKGNASKVLVLDATGGIDSSFNASTTQKGLAEIATDAEVVTGTDEERYINSKQLLDNTKVYKPDNTTLITTISPDAGWTGNTDYTKTYTPLYSGHLLVKLTNINNSSSGSNTYGTFNMSANILSDNQFTSSSFSTTGVYPDEYYIIPVFKDVDITFEWNSFIYTYNYGDFELYGVLQRVGI